MNRSEHIAKLLVEELVPGSEMRFQSDQTGGSCDFELLQHGNLLGVLEVTASVDAQLEETIAAITNKKKGGEFIPARHCRFDWWVHPLPTARINKLRSKLDEYLAAVESEGRTNFFSYTDAAGSDAVRRLLIDLGIEGASVVRWNPPGQIGISLPGGGGRVDAEDAQRAVELEAAKTDNRAKLGKCPSLERHLFVYVDPMNYLPWVALVEEEPPTCAPSLPTEVTHIWAAAESRKPRCFTVWKAVRGSQWERMGPVGPLLIPSFLPESHDADSCEEPT